MSHSRLWTLGAKLALVATPFALLALVSIAATLWVSLIWMYWTEVRGTELMGSKARAFRLHG